jgi:hypothetical protein
MLDRSTYALGCLPLAALFACNAPPGELLGVYSITGELSENSCGNSALPAPDPLQFDVEIRRISDSEALWIQAGPPGNTGSLDQEGEFEFQSQGTFGVNAPDQTASTELLEMDPLSLANLDTFEAFEAGATEGGTCVLSLSELARGRLMRDSLDADDAGSMRPEDKPDLLGENVIEIRTAEGDCSPVLAAQGGPFDSLPCRAHYELSGKLKD